MAKAWIEYMPSGALLPIVGGDDCCADCCADCNHGTCCTDAVE